MIFRIHFTMNKRLIFLLVLATIFITSCQQGFKSPGASASDDPNKATVREVIQTSSYSYLRVEKGEKEEWIAISKADIRKGATVFYTGGLEMTNFQSPELGRTFERVLFVSEISMEPLEQDDPHPGMDMGMKGGQPAHSAVEKLEISLDKAEGGLTIAEVYANRETYSGRLVKVRGKVTKVNKGIMGRNWVHVQDGTADGDNYALTITTEDLPSVGDIMTYSGTLSLKKDFGYGYFYEVIVEEAMPVTLN